MEDNRIGHQELLVARSNERGGCYESPKKEIDSCTFEHLIIQRG